MTDTAYLRRLALDSNDGYLCGPALTAADSIDALEADNAALRTRIAELEGEKDRLEVAVGWLADVSAATAYGAAELKSTSKAERNRQAVIMEKVIAILDGAPAPTRGAQTGVRARCQRTLAELLATLNGEKKHG